MSHRVPSQYREETDLFAGAGEIVAGGAAGPSWVTVVPCERDFSVMATQLGGDLSGLPTGNTRPGPSCPAVTATAAV